MTFPNISACLTDGCKTMNINDVTGLLNTNSNPGGYGTPNITKATVDLATLQIKAPGQTGYTTFTVTQTVSTSNALASDFLLLTLSYSDLGLTTNFTDGIYEFIYTVHDISTNEEAVKKTSKVFLCNAKCCINTQIVSLKDTFNADCGCCENKEKIKDLQLADMLIKSVEDGGNCIDVTKLNNILTILARVCQGKNCCD